MVSLPSAVDMPLLMVMPGPTSGLVPLCLSDHSRDQPVQGIELSSVFRDKDLCCCDWLFGGLTRFSIGKLGEWSLVVGTFNMKNGTLSEYCERVTKYWWQLYKGTCEPLQEEACQIQEELTSTSQSLYSFPHTSEENMDPDADHMWYINSNIPLYNLWVDMTKLRIKMLKEQCPKIYRFFY